MHTTGVHPARNRTTPRPEVLLAGLLLKVGRIAATSMQARRATSTREILVVTLMISVHARPERSDPEDVCNPVCVTLT